MEDMAKHGGVGLAAARAGMDRKTAHKYVKGERGPRDLSAQWTLVLLLALCGCGAVRPRSMQALGPSPWESVPSGLSAVPMGDGEGVGPRVMHLPVRTAAEEESARTAEVERALAHVEAISTGATRVGTRLTLAYWREAGALTLVSYRAHPGEAKQAGRVEEPNKLGREVRLALTGYGTNSWGQVELVIRRDQASWVLESVTRTGRERPAEARHLPVRQHGVAAESYIRAHAAASRVVRSLQVPEGLVLILIRERGKQRYAGGRGSVAWHGPSSH
jgi:hypothetical protein